MRSIDAYLERGEELMRLNRVAFDRNTEAFERNREAFDRNTEAFERNREALDRNAEAFERNAEAFERHERATDRILDEHRQFMREMTRRSERVTRQLVAAVREDIGKGDAIIEELRAQRQALFRILDRPAPPEAPA